MNSLDAIGVPLDGTNLIEASAGTGKTYTIATLYLRFLLESELEVEQILVVTYTRAATAELRGRIRVRLVEARKALLEAADSDDPVLAGLQQRFSEPEARARAVTRLAEAIAGFDRAAIFTIHGFCQRILQEHAFESGVAFETDFVSDSKLLLSDVVADFWANLLDAADEPLLRHLAARKSKLADWVELAARAVADPEMPILPEQAVAGDDTLAEEWRATFEQLRLHWSRDCDEVADLLISGSEAGDLSKAYYSETRVRKNRVPPFEAALRSEQVLALEKPLADFTSAKLAEKTNKNGTTPQHPFFELCDQLAALLPRMLAELDARILAMQLGLVEFVRRKLPERKREAGIQSYDDLLSQLHAALTGPGGGILAGRIRARHRAALIDEFQDTDEVQYEILRRVWHAEGPADDGRALFLIGDPKQAIYGFRGADVFAYLVAKQDAGEKAHTLATNWRSDPGLISAIQCLFERSSDPFVLEGISFEPVAPRPNARDQLGEGPPFEILMLREEESILAASGAGKGWIKKDAARSVVAQRVAAEISALLGGSETLDGRAVRPRDIAVLCRTNHETGAMREALEDLDIPVAVVGGTSVWDAAEAAQLERVLAAMAEPGDRRMLRVALATPILGLDAAQLDALAEDEEGWEVWVGRFRSWHTTWSERGFIQALHQMLSQAEVHARLLTLRDGERRITNLLHLAEMLQRRALERHLGPVGVVEWLERMRTDSIARSEGLEEEDLLRLESDSEAVTVLTIHKSKGLEYPIVYCPFLWDGNLLKSADEQWLRFHDAEHDDRLSLDLASDARDAHLEQAKTESLAESMRLLYVALTRARHRCSIVWGRVSEAEGSPLAHLLHTPQTAEAGPTSARQHVRGLSEGELLDEIRVIAEDSKGLIRTRDLIREAARRSRTRAGSLELTRRTLTRRLSFGWRHSSFSALTAGGREAARRPHDPVEESADYDAVTEEAALAIGDDAIGDDAIDEGASAEVSLNRFPSGALAGTFLHEVLEKLDFADVNRVTLEPKLEQGLARHGFPVGLASGLVGSLEEIVSTRWGAEAEAPVLEKIDGARRLDELEFLLPVASAVEGGASPPPLEGGALADVFARHAQDDFVRAYAEPIRELRFLPLSGYLKGFIDLVFEWQGAFHLVDYKSNHLGANAAAYLPGRLPPVMAEHHYILQYHLYLVALHRHLGARLPGYDYDTHIGGAWYLFLRGMSPTHPPGCGVFRDRPPRELIEGLSGLFGEVRGGVAA